MEVRILDPNSKWVHQPGIFSLTGERNSPGDVATIASNCSRQQFQISLPSGPARKASAPRFAARFRSAAVRRLPRLGFVLYLARVSGRNVAVINTCGTWTRPESYAMVLAGLGLIGFVARRRKQKAA